MELLELDSFPTVEAFYLEHPAAHRSPESDYGVWWRDDDGGVWRVTYVHHTGHVYAVRSAGVRSGVANIGGQRCVLVSAGPGDGPVIILGQLPTFSDEREAEVRAASPYRVAAPPEMERAMEGWPDQCGPQGGLAWVLERVTAEAARHG